MSGPREFRAKFYGRVPNPDEWKAWLKMKLAECEEGWDSVGDYDFSVGRAQEYINSWPKIFTEEGGI